MLAVADLSSSGREKKYYHGQLWLNMISWKFLTDSRVKYRSEKYRPIGPSHYSGQTKQDKKNLNVTKSRKKEKEKHSFNYFDSFFIILLFASKSHATDLNLVKIKGLYTCLFIDLRCDIFIFSNLYCVIQTLEVVEAILIFFVKDLTVPNLRKS